MRILVADGWGQFNRGALLGRRARPNMVLGATLQTGTVVYLSPRAQEPGRDLEAVLRHELTHALLFQHTRFADTFEPARLDWFEEGLAVHYGNAAQYLDDETWQRLAVEEGRLVRVTGDPKAADLPGEQRYAFMATEHRLFMAFLMHRYGEDRFFAYRDRVLAAPARHGAAFRQTFGAPLGAGIEAFERAVRSGAWPLAEEGPAPSPTTLRTP